MAATYPLAVKAFTAKKNLFDDVEASHINDIQDEIAALETVLGVTPNYDGGLGITYKDIATRLSALRSRVDLPVWNLYRADRFDVVAATGSPNVRVPMMVVGDTHGLFNGTGITIQRAGYYHINAGTIFTPVPVKGVRSLIIRRYYGNVGSAFAVAAASFPHFSGTVYYSNGGLDCTYTGPFNAGDSLDVAVSLDNWDAQDTGIYSVAGTHIHGFMIRDLV